MQRKTQQLICNEKEAMVVGIGDVENHGGAAARGRLFLFILSMGCSLSVSVWSRFRTEIYRNPPLVSVGTEPNKKFGFVWSVFSV